jgi:hypothetical protein
MMNQFQSDHLATQHRQQLQIEAEQQRLAQAAADPASPAQPAPAASLLHLLVRVLVAVHRPAVVPHTVSPT